jgi:hypothetical protein
VIAINLVSAVQSWTILNDQPALAACREAAVKAKKEQHCRIVVPVP